MANTELGGETCVAVGAANVAGTTTALTVFATPYTCTGSESNIFVDNSAGAVTVNLPNVDRNAAGSNGGGPTNHPLRGKEIRIQNVSAAANVITIAAPSTGSVQAAPQIDGAASPNTTLLPGGAKHSVVLVFDGLNWQVTSVR